MRAGRILVTGAAGFVGGALVAHLRTRGKPVVGVVRAAATLPDLIAVGDLLDIAWAPLLEDVDAVVHLAALAHRAADERTFERGNVEVTERLVAAAASARVRRFVYASSVKVNGEETTVAPYREDDRPRPVDAYGRTKFAAERIVVARGGTMETVVLRPPLVYGPGVSANFLALVRGIDRGLPLPLGSVRNARSLLFVGNLVSAIEVAIDHPAAAGGTFLLSDGHDLSTPALVREIAAALGRAPRLVPFPPTLLEWLGALAGRGDTVRRLTRSLQVDPGRFRALTAWTPPFTVAQGIAATIAWYRQAQRDRPRTDDERASSTRSV